MKKTSVETGMKTARPEILPEEEMSHRKRESRRTTEATPFVLQERLPLWQLDIAELTGHNLEARGREEVNRLLQEGWHLLHIYTLKYEEDGVWRERPMAILGKLRDARKKNSPSERGEARASELLFRQEVQI